MPTQQDQSTIKTISEYLPLATVYVLLMSYISMATYYGYFNIEPFSFFEIGDLSKFLLNNIKNILLITSFTFIVILFPLIIGALSTKMVKYLFEKVWIRICCSILVIGLFWFAGHDYIEFFTEKSNSLSFNSNSSIPLDYVRKYFYTFMVFMSLALAFMFIKEDFRQLKFLIIPIIVGISIYIPTEAYFNANALEINFCNRNISLITKDNVILPFSKDTFIVGSNSDLYFYYNVNKRMIETIKKDDVVNVLIFDKIKLNYNIPSKFSYFEKLSLMHPM